MDEVIDEPRGRKLRYRQKVPLIETLAGLEAETEDGRIYLLKNYRMFRRVPVYNREKLPFNLNFEECGGDNCPRIAVAL